MHFELICTVHRRMARLRLAEVLVLGDVVSLAELRSRYDSRRAVLRLLQVAARVRHHAHGHLAPWCARELHAGGQVRWHAGGPHRPPELNGVEGPKRRPPVHPVRQLVREEGRGAPSG